MKRFKPVAMDELAFKHLTANRFDQTNRHLRKLRRRFGRRAAEDALCKAANILRMVDPTNPRLRKYPK